MGLLFPLTVCAQTQFQPKALLRPKEESGKLGKLYKASEWYLSVGTVLDGFSTVRVLDHPTQALRQDHTDLARFYGVETGWAGPVFGRRNTAAVVAANTLLNAGLGKLSRNLYHRGGRWRYVALGINLWKATDSVTAGIGNFRYVAGINDKIRAETGYHGQIIWTH